MSHFVLIPNVDFGEQKQLIIVLLVQVKFDTFSHGFTKYIAPSHILTFLSYPLNTENIEAGSCLRKVELCCAFEWADV